MQNTQTATIDSVIGANLRRLREAERLDLIDVSELLWHVMQVRMSVSMVSRWETGKAKFTVDDLHMWARFYQVNALGLLDPHDRKPDEGRTVTDIITTKNGTVIPVKDYLSQLYIEPRGTYLDHIAAERDAIREAIDDVDTRTAELTDATLADLTERLGAKARPADLISAIREATALEITATFPTVTVTTTGDNDAESEDSQDT